MRVPPSQQADCDVEEGRDCQWVGSPPPDRCQAGCCALGRSLALGSGASGLGHSELSHADSAASAGCGGLAGGRLVVRALAALILPGLVWIAAILVLSPYLGELAACAVGVLAWLLLLLAIRGLTALAKLLRSATDDVGRPGGNQPKLGRRKLGLERTGVR